MIRYSKPLVALTAIVLTLVVGGVPASLAGGPVTFATGYGAMEFTFPPGWFQNREKHPYDLHCFSENEQMVTGIFVFKKVDLAESSTPYSTLNAQIEDMASKRTNFTVHKPQQQIRYRGKDLTTVVYSGEKNRSRYLYRFTLIEFDNDKSQFAVALQVAIPGQWSRSEPILDAITRSARSLH